MTIRLTNRELRLLDAAAAAILGAEDDADHWVNDVTASVAPLADVDSVVCVQVNQSEGGSRLATHADGSSPDLATAISRLAGAEGDDIRVRHAVSSVALQRATRGSLWTWRVEEIAQAAGVREFLRSEMHSTLFRPGLASDAVGIGTTPPIGSASLVFGRRKPASHARRERNVALLRLLAPAFRARVEIQTRLGQRLRSLANVVDLLPDAVLLIAPNGHELHRNRALVHLLASDPSATVIAEMRTAAERLAGVASGARSGRATNGHGVLTTTASQCLRTPAGGCYSLTVARLPPETLGIEGAVLVTVRHDDPQLNPNSTRGTHERTGGLLSTSFGLTPREREVAALLAGRHTNAEIAAVLGVSAHTARHHTERVLAKLGVRSRREVAALLQGSMQR